MNGPGSVVGCRMLLYAWCSLLAALLISATLVVIAWLHRPTGVYMSGDAAVVLEPTTRVVFWNICLLAGTGAFVPGMLALSQTTKDSPWYFIVPACAGVIYNGMFIAFFTYCLYEVLVSR